MSSPRQYWFPAKRFGWGWGLPLTWQGWVILLVWTAALTAAAARLLPTHPIAFLGLAMMMAALLTLICYITGEPPRWRWGKMNE
jgi:hypothetical protein